MHALQFLGPLSILLAPVKDRLFTWIPDVVRLFLRFHCDSSFSPLHCCLEAVEGWVGCVLAKHSYISPIKSNVTMGAGLSLESVPKIAFYRNSGDRGLGMGDAASLAAGCPVARGWVLGEHPQPGLPYLPCSRFGTAVVATALLLQLPDN